MVGRDRCRKPCCPRVNYAAEWHALLAGLDPLASADEQMAIAAADVFTAYLARCRKDDASLSTLPPGRFLMPGDYKGSPLLAFAPLDIQPDAVLPKGSLGALMERRYQSYVSSIVKPFFYGHFAGSTARSCWWTPSTRSMPVQLRSRTSRRH